MAFVFMSKDRSELHIPQHRFKFITSDFSGSFVDHVLLIFIFNHFRGSEPFFVIVREQQLVDPFSSNFTDHSGNSVLKTSANVKKNFRGDFNS
jgi:hypothetical protein